jgi:hypothetical protein
VSDEITETIELHLDHTYSQWENCGLISRRSVSGTLPSAPSLTLQMTTWESDPPVANRSGSPGCPFDWKIFLTSGECGGCLRPCCTRHSTGNTYPLYTPRARNVLSTPPACKYSYMYVINDLHCFNSLSRFILFTIRLHEYIISRGIVTGVKYILYTVPVNIFFILKSKANVTLFSPTRVPFLHTFPLL